MALLQTYISYLIIFYVYVFFICNDLCLYIVSYIYELRVCYINNYCHKWMSCHYCLTCSCKDLWLRCFDINSFLFNMQHPTFGINSLTLFVSLIHILVFHLLTTLHKSDPHCHHHLCHHHLCHHQSLLLFFTLDLKHTSSSSLFHLDFTIDTHWTNLTDSWPDRFSFAHRFCFSF